MARLDGLNILLVEDDVETGELASISIEQAGGKATMVGSTRAAFEVLESLQPDVLVSDIGLPDEDGYALIRRLRRQELEWGGFTPAVALTGRIRPQDRADAFAAGFQRHVPKPIDPVALMAAIAVVAPDRRGRGSWSVAATGPKVSEVERAHVTRAVSRGSVLVVDDDETLLSGTSRILRAAGFDVAAAIGVPDALPLLEAGGLEAVVSDIAMPGQDGVALLRAARARDLDLPVVLMTGVPTVESAIEAIDYGVLKYLIKPVETKALVDTLARAVQLHRLAKIKRVALSVLGTHTGEGSDRAGLEASFESALGSLWIAYQPIVRASDRSLFGYEALLRTEEVSLPHPGAVIDAAERLDRLPDLSRAIRRRISIDTTGSDPAWTIFVNVHPLDLQDPMLVGSDANPFAAIAARVVLEITERASLECISEVSIKVGMLRARGFRIAIDDLGAGYAGLSSFVQLEPDVVKLDMSLVRDVDSDPVKQRLVRSMTSLCHDMKLLVVAEGIETESERDAVVALECDLLQGYRLGRPQTPFAGHLW